MAGKGERTLPQSESSTLAPVVTDTPEQQFLRALQSVEHMCSMLNAATKNLCNYSMNHPRLTTTTVTPMMPTAPPTLPVTLPKWESNATGTKVDSSGSLQAGSSVHRSDSRISSASGIVPTDYSSTSGESTSTLPVLPQAPALASSTRKPTEFGCELGTDAPVRGYAAASATEIAKHGKIRLVGVRGGKVTDVVGSSQECASASNSCGGSTEYRTTCASGVGDTSGSASETVGKRINLQLPPLNCVVTRILANPCISCQRFDKSTVCLDCTCLCVQSLSSSTTT
jgi:hypothetical protein